jgi:hypothetical protein
MLPPESTSQNRNQTVLRYNGGMKNSHSVITGNINITENVGFIMKGESRRSQTTVQRLEMNTDVANSFKNRTHKESNIMFL